MGNATSTVLDKVLKEIPEEQDKKSGVPTIRYSVAVLLDEEKDFSGQEEKDSISFHPVTTSSPIDHLPRANLKTNPLERNKQRASSFLHQDSVRMESQKRAHSMPQIPGQFLYPNMISISQEALDDKDQIEFGPKASLLEVSEREQSMSCQRQQLSAPPSAEISSPGQAQKVCKLCLRPLEETMYSMLDADLSGPLNEEEPQIAIDPNQSPSMEQLVELLNKLRSDVDRLIHSIN